MFTHAAWKKKTRELVAGDVFIAAALRLKNFAGFIGGE